jgi:cardiolipin synthase A/B
MPTAPDPWTFEIRIEGGMGKVRKKTVMWILAAVLATTMVMILVLNLTSGEKKIDHEIAHLYGVGDPQFVRFMGVLLGPTMVGGNHVVALQNGAEIFSAVLEAIRGAQESIAFETYITGRA